MASGGSVVFGGVSGDKWLETCSVHGGMELTKYCGQCDDICCETCVSDTHRSCNMICTIQEAARSMVDNGDTVDAAQGRLKNIRSELFRLLDDKKAQHLETTNKTKDVYHRLKHVKHTFVNYLEQSEENVMTRYQSIQMEELCFITEAENLIRDIEANMTKEQDSINSNEQTLFVYKKRIQRLLERKDECVSKYGAIPKPGHTDDTVQGFTDDLVGFCERIPDYTATLSGRYSLREQDDEKMCTIMGSCLLKESGTIFVTDWNNSNLKKLDTSYKVCESLKLAARACDICRTDIDELAVTIPFKKLVQFVNINDRMTLTRTFPVGDLCRGISCYDDKIVVLCGGFDGDGERVTCANAGSAKLFTKGGMLLQELKTDCNQEPLFKYPTHVIASRPFENLYISDERTGIAAFTKTHGQFIKMIILPDIKYPTGMYNGDRNWIFVSCYDSNQIFLVNTESSETRVLLTEADGIKSPLTPCFDKSRSKLFVGMCSNDDILVFDVKKIIKV